MIKPFMMAVLMVGSAMAAEPYRDVTLPAGQRAADLLGRMTVEEKLAYIGGDRKMYIRPIERLHLPEIRMSDGPNGVRCWGNSTAYGGGMALAASWDPVLAEKVGASIGNDARARGVHIVLAPGVNLSRTPLCGRNAEYFGEDPLLAGTMACGFIRGLKSREVMGCIKHFAANNQETARMVLSSEVDERALRELYFPAFLMAIREGQVDTVMNAYSKVNGTYCSHHAWLNEQVLRKEWGFTGIVMSDWGGIHDTQGAALGGTDLEMPAGTHMSPDKLAPLIANGSVPMAVIDTKVRHILTTLIANGCLERVQKDATIPERNPASDAVALEGARAAIVLARNEGGLLPVNPATVRSVLVVGPNAHPAVITSGGSTATPPFLRISILDGIKAAFPKVIVTHHPGIQRPEGKEPIGRDTLTAAATTADLVVLALGFNQRDGNNSVASAGFKDEKTYVAFGLYEGEAHDRSFGLHRSQVDTVQAVAAVNRRTVVVLNSGAGVDPAGWADLVPALLLAWYPGQAVGTAVADVITGTVNPSAKLPVTFGRRLKDYPSSAHVDVRVHDGSTYAEQLGADYREAKVELTRTDRSVYGEGLNVGYRGFDALGIEPWLPFGFGLSYTTYAYDGLRTEVSADGRVPVRFTVRNTGSRAGAEIVQVYVTPAPAPVPRPPKELKGFAKVTLAPGEAKDVVVTLPADAFAYWSPTVKDWVVEKGTYGIQVGASSRDIRLTGSIARTGK